MRLRWWTAARSAPSVRRRAAAALVALAATAAACSGSTGAADHRGEPSPARPATGRSSEPVVLVGDSVLVLVEDELRARLDGRLHVDAVPCRTLADPVTEGCGAMAAGVTIDSGLDALRAAMSSVAHEDQVPEQVVLVLANNASLTDDALAEAMAVAAPAERVWWVNARIDGFGRQDENNRLLDALAARDERAGVIDWYTASEDRDWLSDHVHPDDEGQAVLARLIARHVRCGCTP